MACNCGSTTSSVVIGKVEKVRLGSTEKLGIEVNNLPDCILNDCDYCIDLWHSNSNNPDQDMPEDGVQHYPKSMTVVADDNLCLIELKTSIFGKGYVVGRIVANIPDSDLPSEWRKEIEHFTCNILIY